MYGWLVVRVEASVVGEDSIAVRVRALRDRRPLPIIHIPLPSVGCTLSTPVKTCLVVRSALATERAVRTCSQVTASGCSIRPVIERIAWCEGAVVPRSRAVWPDKLFDVSLVEVPCDCHCRSAAWRRSIGAFLQE